MTTRPFLIAVVLLALGAAGCVTVQTRLASTPAKVDVCADDEEGTSFCVSCDEEKCKTRPGGCCHC
jgi:hypothetical protein